MTANYAEQKGNMNPIGTYKLLMAASPPMYGTVPIYCYTVMDGWHQVQVEVFGGMCWITVDLCDVEFFN